MKTFSVLWLMGFCLLTAAGAVGDPYPIPMIVGSDPGGTENLRVGGSARMGFLASTNSLNVFRDGSDMPTGGGYLALANAAVNKYWVQQLSAANHLDYYYYNGVTCPRLMRIQNTGEVLIGADPSGSGLLRVGGGADVKGTVRCKEVVVTLVGWADSVFDAAYILPSLGEVRAYIQEHGHLPGILSEKALLHEGLNVAEMQRSQMAKIEELTLYAIRADQDRSELRDQIAGLRVQLAKQQAEIDKILAGARR